jgi:hypothetical protein
MVGSKNAAASVKIGKNVIFSEIGEKRGEKVFKIMKFW